jgi:predicted nucleotidyltransferase
MVTPPVLQAFLTWADRERSIHAITLFGTWAQGRTTADSDFDLQLVTSEPGRFEDRGWIAGIPGWRILAYAVRDATGGARKVTLLLEGAEFDFVIVPAHRLRLARLLVRCGLHRTSRRLARALGPLAVVMRPGHQVVRGGPGWARFYERVVREVPDPRLDRDAVLALAETAYVDLHWILGKIDRGELVAAQRWLHRTPVEVNLRLLTESRQRRGLDPVFDGRRSEMLLTPAELHEVRISAALEPAALTAAVLHCEATLRRRVLELTDAPAPWPALMPRTALIPPGAGPAA